MIDNLPMFFGDSGRDYAERTDLPALRDTLLRYFSEFGRGSDTLQVADLAMLLGQPLPGAKIRDLEFSNLDREVFLRNVTTPMGSQARLARVLGLLLDRLIDVRDRLPGSTSWVRARANALADVLFHNWAPVFKSPFESASNAGYSAVLSRLVARHLTGRLEALGLLTEPQGFIPEPCPFSEFARGRDHFDSGIPFDQLTFDSATKTQDAVLALRLRRLGTSNQDDQAWLPPADPRARRALGLYRSVTPYMIKLELAEQLKYGLALDGEGLLLGTLDTQAGWAVVPTFNAPDVVEDLNFKDSHEGVRSLRFADPNIAVRHALSLGLDSLVLGFWFRCRPLDRGVSTNGLKLRLWGTNDGGSALTQMVEVGVTRSQLQLGVGHAPVDYTLVQPFLDPQRFHFMGLRVDLLHDTFDVWVDNMFLARAVPVEFVSTTVDAVDLVMDGEPGDVFHLDDLRIHQVLNAA